MNIYIFGPSCSGKSTLAKTLQQRLGDQWTYLDRDQLIESGLCPESAADTTLEERIQAVKTRVIIDAQIPWKEKKEEEIYCLLLPPLGTLLERDAQRTKALNRSERRALRAKEYVIHTHETLRRTALERFDVCFDSSLIPIEQTVVKLLQLLQKKM